MSFHKNNTVPHLIGGTVGHSQKILVHRYSWEIWGYIGKSGRGQTKKNLFFAQFVSETI